MADSNKQPDQQEAVKEKELLGKHWSAVWCANVHDLYAPVSSRVLLSPRGTIADVECSAPGRFRKTYIVRQ